MNSLGFSVAMKMIASSIIVFAYFFSFFMPFTLPKFVTRSDNRINQFGYPEAWPSDMLPTRVEVIRHFHLKREELQVTSKTVPSNREIATKVCNYV